MADNRANIRLREHSAANDDANQTTRLPVEMLLSIFQLIVDGMRREYDMKSRASLKTERRVDNNESRTERPGFTAAKVLSHVCSRWRLISVDSARLWTDIALSLVCRRVVFDHFISTIFPRVKSTPCRLFIDDIDLPTLSETDEPLLFLSQRRLKFTPVIPLTSCTIPPSMNISELQFGFLRVRSEYTHPTFLDYLGSIKGTVTGITLCGGGVRPSCLGRIMAALPQVRKVSLRCMNLRDLDLGASCGLLEELILEHPRGLLDWPKIFDYLSNLAKLSVLLDQNNLAQVIFDDRENTKLTNPTIRELHVTSVNLWARYRNGNNGAPSCFPSLESLVVETDANSTAEFIKNHPKITQLIVCGVEYALVHEYLAYRQQKDEEELKERRESIIKRKREWDSFPIISNEY